MLNGLFTAKETLKYDIGYCKLYDTRLNGVVCTKMYFILDSPLKYEFLKQVKHFNIIPIFKITQHSIFTKHVIPFSTILDKNKSKYNEYIILKLKEAVDYIHTELKIEHNNIAISSLFVDGNGNVMIGRFDSYTEFVDNKNDYYLLNEICQELLNKNVEEIEEKENLFFSLEKREIFDNFTNFEKRDFIRRIIANQSDFIEFIKINIFKILLDDISKTADKDYKIFVVESLMSFDYDIFITFTKSLFAIIDSSIRLYLLQNMKNITNLDDCVDEISLGLRVKDKTLKLETIAFVFRNENCFNQRSFSKIIETMAMSINDTESIGIICLRLIDLNRQDISKDIYQLITAFIIINKNISLVYKCTEKYYPTFNKFKMSTELLPLLCSKLSDKENQDTCFVVVEKILVFLKSHKNEIYNKEWSFKSIKSMFVTKKVETESAVDERIKKFSKNEETYSEWDDQESA